MKNKAKSALILLSAAAILIAGYYWFSSSRANAIEYSLVQMVNSQYFPAYQIRKGVKSLETDSSGEWWLSLDKEFSASMINHDELKQADAADTEYMIEVFSEKVNSNIRGKREFVLYRGERVLGENTVCAQSLCNIYVLSKVGSKDIYLAIYKN